MHIRGTKIEREIGIYAANLANEVHERIELSGEFVKTYSSYR
jgi:hypothetical protein